ASVPLSPSRSCATSPGTRCIPKNTRTLTPRSVGMSCPNRRPMYLSISGSHQAVEGPPGSPAGPNLCVLLASLRSGVPAGGNLYLLFAQALLERHLLHVEEHLQRVELKSLDVRPRRADLVRVVHEDPRRVIVQDFVGLLIALPPLALIADLAPLDDQPVELGVVVAGPVVRPRLPGGGVPLEQVAEEVV